MKNDGNDNNTINNNNTIDIRICFVTAEEY